MANKSLVSLDRRAFFGLALGAVTVSPLAARAQGAKLKIATIGAGREGGALGTVFAKAGYPVMFSSRNPDLAQGPGGECRSQCEGRHGG